MFCNQCEETSKGVACTVRRGVCGKSEEVAALQDLLMHSIRDLATHASLAREAGWVDEEVNHFTCEAVFATLTNVNFDPERLQRLIKQAQELRDKVREELPKNRHDLAGSLPSALVLERFDISTLIEEGNRLGFLISSDLDPDVRSLQEILLYGVKGVAAYAHHAQTLGQEDDSVYRFIHEAFAALGNKEWGGEQWLDMVLRCGEINLKTMELLDKAHTSAFGNPVPTSVPLGHRKGKCILVSGHDLKDLKNLLEQTQGKGIDVYTHGEMLPAHGYPELKKFPHLFGHYGTAWPNQRKEFAAFPGAILINTNCIQEPHESYRDRILTTGPVGWPGVQHLAEGEYGKLIEKALSLPGFESDEDRGSVMCGFAHSAILSSADKIIQAVKDGKIRHFILVGGCDGARTGRNYYTELVEKTPGDTVVMTLACGKFRFFDRQLGTIEGIPRLLDIGQCNDAYSAIKVALALADAFGCGVNELPLSLVLSWYEQKAVAILLTLLYLGVKNMRLGPTLPAFISPGVLGVLVDNFDIKPISSPEEDLQAILCK
ncbi:MAG: hydroxylamine reductase [Syntrophothermus sp.]|uniref:hydroxylamine reductase n=1 Tax=Syntrophothermus sp. TaxID=2736299 RepID=UPI00257A4BB3|nr:hydroxylamine reductase [Syntrophothermus sp.]NSW82389.1 hydroxylamine reductase [Syntrophothermus sp.]